MSYVKATLVGIVTLVIATIGYVICAAEVLLRRYPPPPGVEVGIALGPLLFHPTYGVIAIAAFALGFFWQLSWG